VALETFNNFPITKVVAGLISYTQYVFGSPEHVEPDYRWNEDDRQTKIRISAPFAIDDERPMSQPFIVFKRGQFTFMNNMVDDVKTAEPNTFENMEKVVIANGNLNIICGSRSAVEATGLAQFMSILLQANRHNIAGNSNMEILRNLNHVAISDEMPVFKDAQVTRWEVNLNVFLSLQFGWFERLIDPVLWTKIDIKNVDESRRVESDEGITSSGSDLLVDPSKDFGFLNTNDPQFLQQDFDRGWYYIQFKDNQYKQLYKIVEVVNPTTLRLVTHDANELEVPWSSPSSETDVEYTLFWNSVHLHVRVPNNSS
jgi:hypothetical protein